jgi:hypothetical protein
MTIPKRKHSLEFKAEAIKLAARLGVLSDRGLRRLRRDELIFDAFQTIKQRSGVVRIQQGLEAQGHTCDVKTITCSMRRQGLVAKATRRFKVTTDSDHSDRGSQYYSNVYREPLYDHQLKQSMSH